MLALQVRKNKKRQASVIKAFNRDSGKLQLTTDLLVKDSSKVSRSF
jgi:hypothetical protein